MAAVASYSFKDTVCLVSGIPILDFADGDDVISIERNEDAFSLLVGADGAAMALFNPDRSGIATLRLLQSSRSNAYLSGFVKLQESGVLSPFPFIVKDLNGLDLALAESAFMVGPPPLRYGAGHNAREWRLILPAVEIFAGGSS